jgi:hypothetical protein
MTLQEKINQAIEAKQKLLENQDAILAENDSYINYLADAQTQQAQVNKLDAIINKLNGMKPIVTNDGTKYAIHCYPISESIFGPIGSRLLAIATIAGAMFTTERQVEFTALTQIPYLIALDASHQLGKPAYLSKANILVEAVPYAPTSYLTALTAVAHQLGLSIAEATAITTDKLDRYFTQAEAKALTKLAEAELTATLDDSPFTLED